MRFSAGLGPSRKFRARVTGRMAACSHTGAAPPQVWAVAHSLPLPCHARTAACQHCRSHCRSRTACVTCHIPQQVLLHAQTAAAQCAQTQQQMMHSSAMLEYQTAIQKCATDNIKSMSGLSMGALGTSRSHHNSYGGVTQSYAWENTCTGTRLPGPKDARCGPFSMDCSEQLLRQDFFSISLVVLATAMASCTPLFVLAAS